MEGARMGETPGGLAGIRIAIVEDDALLRESFGLFLRAKGCRVEMFGSAEEAGDARKLGGFDVVISNFLLRGENGYSLLRRVHAASKTVKTVLVSAHGNKGFPEETRRAGIDAYLPKPLSTEELESALQRLIGNVGGGNQAIPVEIA